MSELERIQVSVNKRFLVTESGKPFFWLGDTAWELFHRLNREETDKYLENRRERGFNVIQAVVLAEFDGLRTPNANGHIPLVGDDPTRPNEPYFQHIDYVIHSAASKGLYIGLLPTWGDKVNPIWGIGPVIFNTENTRAYGKYLGTRYRKDSNIIWILGGDRNAEGYENLWASMSYGIENGLGRKPLMTYHPNGGCSSAMWFHDTDWLDFNMWQSGHVQLDAPNWEMITTDYTRLPVKPVIDGEPNYEDHPIDPFTRRWLPEFGRFTDYDVRKQAYRAVFAGAAGHTYGHHSVWQFWTLDRIPINHPMPAWEEAILRPGAAQLIHMKNLVLSRPYLNRIPGQGLLASDPGEGASHVCATRGSDGSYAFVYIPKADQPIEIDLRKMAGSVKAWWYDPRDGRALPAGEFSNKAVHKFTSPIAGPDWVLVLDVASESYPAPGKVSTL